MFFIFFSSKLFYLLKTRFRNVKLRALCVCCFLMKEILHTWLIRYRRKLNIVNWQRGSFLGERAEKLIKILCTRCFGCERNVFCVVGAVCLMMTFLWVFFFEIFFLFFLPLDCTKHQKKKKNTASMGFVWRSSTNV